MEDIFLTTLLNPVARCNVKDNKTWDKDGFLDGIRDSMFSHILTVFTAFDWDSLVTPLSKDGFELTSIAKKLYKSRSISSFDSMIGFGVGGHGTSGRSLILCNILVAKFLIMNWCLYTNACRSETWYQGWILFSMNTQIRPVYYKPTYHQIDLPTLLLYQLIVCFYQTYPRNNNEVEK